MVRAYNPKIIEKKWNNIWQSEKFFQPTQKGNPYCIVLPPPNITGTLHIGHAFQQTLIDILIRKHRMEGDSVLWQSGTDHAGIATQIVVEKKLRKRGISREELGRENFLKETLSWKEHSQINIFKQMNSLGCSIDQSRSRFSMDKSVSEATFQAFKILYEEDLIYKGERIVNFDPVLRTAVSDLEVQNTEVDGHLWYIKYRVYNSDKHIVVSTTRPETLFGDTAIAVHPEDKRYVDLIGKMVLVPIIHRLIKVISDTSIKQEFGTGCVKVTPAHDFNDYELGKKHKLKNIKVFNKDACLIGEVPERYCGVNRFIAREKLIEELNKQGLIFKVEKHKHFVPHSGRSGAIIEPMLTKQWFVKTRNMAKDAILAVKNKDIVFFPESWEKTYLHWMENIEDWCISRQIWWGHQIPIWYDEKRKTYLGRNKDEVYKNYNLPNSVAIRQEEDVLDTWFTAALWPFSSLDWPLKTEFLKNFYPNNVLITGFDIIFFWVARMIMMGLKLTGKVPFRRVLITGLIKDGQGKKMSKSQGNVIDPLDIVNGISIEDLVKKRINDLMSNEDISNIKKTTKALFPKGIESYGSDALRFTLCSLATFSRDINLDIKRVSGYRNFCNKLWNAGEFISMHANKIEFSSKNNRETGLFDRWILSELQNTIKLANKHIDSYRFDLLAKTLYDFTWNKYCDWYIELSKLVLNSPKHNKRRKSGTLYTLIIVFDNLLRLLHPIIPFITEDLWVRLPKINAIRKSSIVISDYPKPNDSYPNSAKFVVSWLQKIVLSIRSTRSNMNIPSSKKVDIVFKGRKDVCDSLKKFESFIYSTTKINRIDYTFADVQHKSAKIVIDFLEIYISLENLFDKSAEIARINRQITKINKEYQKIVQRIEKSDFVVKAPRIIVARERGRAEILKKEIEQLEKYQTKIQEVK